MSFKKQLCICYIRITKLQIITNKKKKVYDILQIQFAKVFFLVHFDLTCVLYENIDVFKKHDFNIMIFHIKKQ